MRNVFVVLIISISIFAMGCGGSGTKPVEVIPQPEPEKEVIITLGGVLFDKNSATLKPEARDALLAFSGRLAGIQNEILVDGYTDDSGTPAFNLTLSQKRADTVAKALVDVLGVDPSRITAKGYGIADPAYPNTTEENRIRNRRVVVTLLPLVRDEDESLSQTEIVSEQEQATDGIDEIVEAVEIVDEMDMYDEIIDDAQDFFEFDDDDNDVDE